MITPVDAIVLPVLRCGPARHRGLSAKFTAIGQSTAPAPATAWKAYRSSGGRRERVAADFLIGAHAQLQAERLLTRDRGF